MSVEKVTFAIIINGLSVKKNNYRKTWARTEQDSVKHLAEKRLKTDEKRAKTSKNVFTASLLRLYFMFTYSLLLSDTSNFPPIKVQKTCVKHRT